MTSKKTHGLKSTPAQDAPTTTLRLPETLDFAAAATLAETLLEHRSAPAVIDAGAVRQLGAQCLQVLLSAAQTWKADLVALTMVDLSPELIDQLRIFGVDPAILVGGELSQ